MILCGSVDIEQPFSEKNGESKECSHINKIMDFVREENNVDFPLGEFDSNTLDSHGEWEFEIPNMTESNEPVYK